MNINSLYVLDCKACGETFETNHRNTRYCSPQCRVRYNNHKATEKRKVQNAIADCHTEMHWKNHAILRKYINEDVAESVLEKEGFDPKFVTAWERQEVDGKAIMIFFVFDCRYLVFRGATGRIFRIYDKGETAI